MSQVIEVKHLSKQFGEIGVLKDLNFTVAKGEIFGFVGRNGAGKSTFIHILSGLVNKSAGSIEVLGFSDKHINIIKQKIGVMPDVANLYGHMRGLQFLQYMGQLAGDKRGKQDYIALLDSFGLSDAVNQKVKAYSFGMKKKICIAQALLGDPEIIILDEPTSGVDPESAIHIRRLITDLNRAGKTIFLTSHNLDEIERISDRVAFLNDGQIKKIGRPSELKVVTKEKKQVDVLVKTEPSLDKQAAQVLSTWADIDIKWVENKGNQICLSIEGKDMIPRVTEALVANGYDIYSIMQVEQSLEEVFMNA